MYKNIFDFLRKIFGIILIIIGIIGLFLPVIQGTLLIIAGLLLLGIKKKTMGKWIKKFKLRLNKLRKKLAI